MNDDRERFVDPLDVTNLDQDGVFQFLISEGYPATRYMVKWMFLRREVKPVRLGNGNYVSRRDVLNWIESRRQPGRYRAPERGLDDPAAKQTQLPESDVAQIQQEYAEGKWSVADLAYIHDVDRKVIRRILNAAETKTAQAS